MKSTKSMLHLILAIGALLLAPGVVTAQARPPAPHDTLFSQGLLAAASGRPLHAPFLIADQPVDAVSPAVAYNSQAQEYLVVWWNNRAANDDIYGQRVSKNGTLAGPWFSIAAGTGIDREYPQVVYNSQQNEYLVVWFQDDGTSHLSLGVYGRRVSATGQLLGSEIDIAISTLSAQYIEGAAAYDSTDDKYLVIYLSYISSTTKFAVIAQALNSDGSVWGTSFDLASNIGNAALPKLAYNHQRNEFLVAWNQTSSQSEIIARRVKMESGAGTLGSVFPISTDTTNDDFNPRIAAFSRASDGQYLVVWGHCKNSPGCSQINTLAQLVSGEGVLEGGTITFPTPFSDAEEADAAGCGNASAYFVAWMQTNTTTGRGDIGGRYVSTGGGLEPDFWLGGSSAEQPAVACGPNGDYLVAYMNQTPTTEDDIWGRLVGNHVYLPLARK